MKQLKHLVLALFLIVSMPFAGATIDFFEVSSFVEGETAKHNIVMIFSAVPKTLEYPILMPAESVKINANFKGHSCKVEPKSWGTNILCDLSNATGGNVLGITFQSAGGIRKLDEYSSFDVGVRVPDDAKKAVIRAGLGEGLFLIKKREGATSVTPYYPTDGKEGSDGRRIYVVWERESLKKGDSINVGLSYEGSPTAGVNYLYFIIPIPILIGLFLVFRKFGRGLSTVIPVLKEDERRVVEVVQSYGGRCKQRKIVADTTYSKARVSRLVHSLKERGVLEVLPKGRTNEVVLKELKMVEQK